MSRLPKDVAARLLLLQSALELTAADIERRAGIRRNAWSQFTDWDKYKRRITMAAAFKLKDAFGVTLEWLYDNDGSRLPADLAERIRKARKAKAA